MTQAEMLLRIMEVTDLLEEDPQQNSVAALILLNKIIKDDYRDLIFGDSEHHECEDCSPDFDPNDPDTETKPN